MTTLSDARALADRADKFVCLGEIPRETEYLLQQAAATIRELCAMVEAQDWQPIETARKDSGIDIWIARGSRIAIASWFAKWDYCRGGPYTDCWVQPGGVVFNPPPTHWRPLPPPPTDTVEERT